jgi:hypothetical protein
MTDTDLVQGEGDEPINEPVEAEFVEPLTDTSEFAQIVGQLEFDDLDVSMNDKSVDILLTSGDFLEFVDVDSEDIIRSLISNGLAQMRDVKGQRVTVFTHGVAAIVAGNGDDE